MVDTRRNKRESITLLASPSRSTRATRATRVARGAGTIGHKRDSDRLGTETAISGTGLSETSSKRKRSDEDPVKDENSDSLDSQSSKRSRASPDPPVHQRPRPRVRGRPNNGLVDVKAERMSPDPGSSDHPDGSDGNNDGPVDESLDALAEGRQSVDEDRLTFSPRAWRARQHAAREEHRDQTPDRSDSQSSRRSRANTDSLEPTYDPLRDNDYSGGANPVGYNVSSSQSDNESEGSGYASTAEHARNRYHPGLDLVLDAE
jgi:hypothetical protein